MKQLKLMYRKRSTKKPGHWTCAKGVQGRDHDADDDWKCRHPRQLKGMKTIPRKDYAKTADNDADDIFVTCKKKSVKCKCK